MEKKYPDMKKIKIMPYHNIANDKYKRYGYVNLLPDIQSADEKIISAWRKWFKEHGSKKICSCQDDKFMICNIRNLFAIIQNLIPADLRYFWLLIKLVLYVIFRVWKLINCIN